MEMRTCRYCKTDHPIEFFDKALIVKGKVYRRWKCRNCYREMKKLRKRKIKDWFQEFKKTLKCKKCEENRWYTLDFHHRDPNEKEDTLGNLIRTGCGRKTILEEVKKCDVYCSNCHREIHWGGIDLD